MLYPGVDTSNISHDRDGSSDTAAELASELARLEVSDEEEIQARSQKSDSTPVPAIVRPLIIPSPDIEGIASIIRERKARRIIVMCGAGISVSAGIPDFRTPGTGLYSQLEKYKLDRPEDVFDLDHYRADPMPFSLLAKELFPGQFEPTPTHYFIRLLHEKGLLLRCFSQNIDSLETQAGLPKDKLLAAHGNFDSAHCINCDKEYPISFFKEAVFKERSCRCTKCHKLVKPDIVFFGEDLPERFFSLAMEDFPQCDMLIVMGTSLVVHPFAGLIRKVGPNVPRLLCNRQLVGQNMGAGSFDFEPETNTRDALFLGDCDDGSRELASLLGWQVELSELIMAGRRKSNQKGSVLKDLLSFKSKDKT